MIRCKKTDYKKIIFIKNDKRSSRSICTDLGQLFIESFLGSNGFEIRKLRADDLEYLHVKRKQLCGRDGTLDEILDMFVDDFTEIEDLNNIVINNKKHYVYVITRNEQIISFSIATYDTERYDLYFELTCTLRNKEKRSDVYSKNTNYFICAYMILEALRNKTKLKSISGDMGGDLEKLKPYHTKKGCTIEGNKFKCDIIKYLNIFFEKMDSFNWPQQ